MDFLTQLSVRYTDESRNGEDEEDPGDSGETEDNLDNHPNYVITGDNLVSMLLKPSYTTQDSQKVSYDFLFLVFMFHLPS